MAKKYNPEKSADGCPDSKNQEHRTGQAEEAFLRSLQLKSEVSLQLNSGLAAWFGDLSIQSIRL